jgi:hypothetical protein
MLRKIVLSLIGGFVVALVFSFSTPAKADCGGACMHDIGPYTFVGCTTQIHLGLDGFAIIKTCFYQEIPDPNALPPNVATAAPVAPGQKSQSSLMLNNSKRVQTGTSVLELIPGTHKYVLLSPVAVEEHDRAGS